VRGGELIGGDFPGKREGRTSLSPKKQQRIEKKTLTKLMRKKRKGALLTIRKKTFSAHEREMAKNVLLKGRRNQRGKGPRA